MAEIMPGVTPAPQMCCLTVQPPTNVKNRAAPVIAIMACLKSAKPRHSAAPEEENVRAIAAYGASY